jgi:hypothetical protein
MSKTLHVPLNWKVKQHEDGCFYLYESGKVITQEYVGKDANGKRRWKLLGSSSTLNNEAPEILIGCIIAINDFVRFKKWGIAYNNDPHTVLIGNNLYELNDKHKHRLFRFNDMINKAEFLKTLWEL